MGRPGNPAPEPMSATVSASSKSLTTEDTEDTEGGTGNSMRAANRDSPKWRVTMSSGSRKAVRLMRAVQRTSISMYVDIPYSWVYNSWQAAEGNAGVAACGFSIQFDYEGHSRGNFRREVPGGRGGESVS